MNINTRKNTYRCNVCDDGSKGSKSSGGMLDLYANVMGGMNLSEAYREICEQLWYLKRFIRPASNTARSLDTRAVEKSHRISPVGFGSDRRETTNLLLSVFPADAESSA